VLLRLLRLLPRPGLLRHPVLLLAPVLSAHPRRPLPARRLLLHHVRSLRGVLSVLRLPERGDLDLPRLVLERIHPCISARLAHGPLIDEIRLKQRLMSARAVGLRARDLLSLSLRLLDLFTEAAQLRHVTDIVQRESSDNVRRHVLTDDTEPPAHRHPLSQPTEHVFHAGYKISRRLSLSLHGIFYLSHQFVVVVRGEVLLAQPVD
jgi:hypothetical protein